ncbi:MAG: hypothetical protein ACI9MC_002055 [Kiritimatiellia bacterium]
MHSRLARRLMVLGALGFALPASAQDDLFKLDAVFVSVFKATDEGLEGTARRVEGRLIELLSQEHLVVPIDDIEAFEDYSAEIYLESCALDRAPGCAYVIADRGSANWAVSGVLRPLGPGSMVADVAIVDVDSARVVVQFEIHLDGSNDSQFVSAVAGLIRDLSADGTDPDDVRVESDEGTDGVRLEAISQGLAELEQDLGAMIRGENVKLERPKLTTHDLAELQGGEDEPPWERLQMTSGQYRRMRNASVPVNNWRIRMRGRAGRLMLRGDVSIGSGPYHVAYDGRWAIDPSMPDVVLELDTHQEIVAGSSFSGGAEVGLGLLPWLDGSVFMSSRIGSYTFLIHQELIGQARAPRDATVAFKSSVQVGGRITVAPMPTYVVRPTGTLGVSAWFGPGLGNVVDLDSVRFVEPPPKPTVMIVQFGPGVEIEANPDLQFFGRLQASLPVGSARVWEYDDLVGQPEIISRGAPSGSWGMGLELSVGVQVQLGRFFGKAKPLRP